MAITLGGCGDDGAEPPDAVSLSSSSGSGDTGLFPFDTGITLLYDDGFDGIVAVDVDQGVARRFDYDQKFPGDHQTRLALVGDRLLFPGRPGIYSLPANLEGEPNLIADGLDMTTAGRSDAIWILGTTDAHSTRFQDPPTAELIDQHGQAVIDRITFTSGFPQYGWEEGVVLSGSAGAGRYEVMELPSGATRPLADGYPVDAHGSLVAIVPSDNSRGDLLIEDVAAGTETRVDLGSTVPDGAPLGAIGSATFSPDGRWLAIVVSSDGAAEPGGDLVLVDVEKATAVRVAGADPAFYSSVTWVPDGDALFFSSQASLTPDPGVLGYYRLGEGRAHTTMVDFEGRTEAQTANGSAIPFGPGSAADIAVARAAGPQLAWADGLPVCRVERGPSANAVTGDLPRIPPGPCRLR